MSPSSLSEFERGKSRPGDARMEALSVALDVPVERETPPPGVPGFRDWREFDALDVDPVSRAGLDLFVERGYHGSSMRMIAERCGMTVAGVYHYVPSKHDLLMKLMRQAMTEMLERCLAAEAEADTPRELITALVESLVRYHVFRLDWGYLATNEIRVLDGDDREEMMVGRRRIRQLLQDAVAACRGGRNRPGKVPDQVTARAIVTMCVAIPDWYDDAGRPDPDEVVDQYVALALDLVDA
jgi:AcrR family transcriptional regulator